MSRRGINKVILVGNLGNDPERKDFANGDFIANVSLATSESWTDKQSGEQQERTEWHKLVFRGKLAGIVMDYLKKGSKIYVEGSLKTRKWTAEDGGDRYTTEINAFEMQMLDSRDSGAAEAPAKTGGTRSGRSPI